jgi:hypothetical protein
MVKLSAIVSASANIFRLLGSLLGIWLSLGWQVRKARKAFERELIAQGMTPQDAQRLSAHFQILKDDIMNAFKRSIIRL